MTLHTAFTPVLIPTPARYMKRLCKHFEHRVSIELEENHAKINFPNAPCILSCDETHLTIRIETEDAGILSRVQQAVDRHLKQVAPRETFDINWTTT